jgi:DNA-binding response OmpR family regulator
MGKRLLVIDDEVDIGETVKIRLEVNGYSVNLAYDGLDGIAKAVKTMPDLILLDILMPQVDGFEVCRRLRKIPETQNIPIIMLTAIKSPESLQKAKEAGAQDYLVKPFENGELVEIVRFYLGKQKSEG